jgi:hypothetical protein
MASCCVAAVPEDFGPVLVKLASLLAEQKPAPLQQVSASRYFVP